MEYRAITPEQVAAARAINMRMRKEFEQHLSRIIQEVPYPLPVDDADRTMLDGYFRSSLTAPAFSRQQIVTRGDNECLLCDGTGRLWYIVKPPDNASHHIRWLMERDCVTCAATGRRSPPPADRVTVSGGDPSTGEQVGRTAQGRIQVPRRRGAPGLVRMALGLFLFWASAAFISTPLFFLTRDIVATTSISMALAGSGSIIATNAILGLRRDGQLFGPMWVAVSFLTVLSFTVGCISLWVLQKLGEHLLDWTLSLKARFSVGPASSQDATAEAVVFGLVIGLLSVSLSLTSNPSVSGISGSLPDGVSQDSAVSFAGTWSGQVTQASAQPYLAILTLRQNGNQYTGTVNYPSYKCGGSLHFKTSGNGGIVLRSEIPADQQSRCANGVEWYLHMSDDHVSLIARGGGRDGQGRPATANLSRTA